jgi:hypothetical protein
VIPTLKVLSVFFSYGCVQAWAKLSLFSEAVISISPYFHVQYSIVLSGSECTLFITKAFDMEGHLYHISLALSCGHDQKVVIMLNRWPASQSRSSLLWLLLYIHTKLRGLSVTLLLGGTASRLSITFQVRVCFFWKRNLGRFSCSELQGLDNDPNMYNVTMWLD